MLAIASSSSIRISYLPCRGYIPIAKIMKPLGATITTYEHVRNAMRVIHGARAYSIAVRNNHLIGGTPDSVVEYLSNRTSP